MEGLVSADKKTVLPLKDISVQVKVKGYLVGVSSTLNYSNDTSNPLEVTFRFPLEESFAVVGLEAIIDGRKVKAAVHEKEKARDMYDNAITSGLTAAYAEEKSGDIFSLSLGNLPSGSEAEIKLRMVGELPMEADGRVRFTLPSVLKPRYTPEGSSDPLAATQNPSVKQASVAGVFKFSMSIEGAKKVAEVSSPTHQLKAEEAMDCVNVCIAREGPVRGDVTILIGYKDPHEPMAMVEAAIEGSKTKEMKSKVVMLTFFPKLTGLEETSCKFAAVVPYEFIFVVDRSGSMSGSYIRSASESLVLFLKSIPQGCFFNIISFGTQYEPYSSSSLPCNQQTIEQATLFALNMKADMGGTNLLAPIQYIFSQPVRFSGLSRQVFILTDGSVSNTSSVISEVRKNCHSTRCFTFGIGSGASSALVRGIARASNGSAEFIADSEQMQSKVLSTVKKALQPSANNVIVMFDLPGSYEVKVVPDKIPSIYNGEKTVTYGLLMDKSDDKGRDGLCKAILCGDILGKEFKFEIPFELSGRKTAEEDVSVIHQLAAKVMIQEWQDDGEPYEEKHKKEIIELSCDASVVSRYTAYIAVDEAQNKPASGSMQSYELTAGQLAGGLGSSSGFGTGCGLTLGGGLGQGTGGGFGNGVPLGIGGGLQLGSANIGLLRTPCHTHQQQQQQRLEGSGGLLSQHTVSNSLFTGEPSISNPIDGTTVKFMATIGSDYCYIYGMAGYTVTTMLQCICAMKEYENYSMEELRFADYQKGRKGRKDHGGHMLFSNLLPGRLSDTNNAVSATTMNSMVTTDTDVTPGLIFTNGSNLQCICATKQYEKYSMEELRFVDYQAGRKGWQGMFQQQGINSGLFNQQQPVTSNCSLFNPTARSVFESNTSEGSIFKQQQQGGTSIFNVSAHEQQVQLQQQIQVLAISPFGDSTHFRSSVKEPTILTLPSKPQLPTMWTTSGTMISQTTSSGLFSQQQPISSISNLFNSTAKTVSGNNASGVESKPFNQHGGTSLCNDVAAHQQQAQLEQQLQVLARSPFGDSPLFRTSEEETGTSSKPFQPIAGDKAYFGASSPYKVDLRAESRSHYKPQPLSPSRHKDKSVKSSKSNGSHDPDDIGTADTFKPRKNVKKVTIQTPNSQTVSVSSVNDTTTDSVVGTKAPCTHDEVSTTNTSTPQHATAILAMTMITPPSGNKSLTNSTPPSDTSSVESPRLVVGDVYSNSVMKPVARRPTSPLDNTMLTFNEPLPSSADMEKLTSILPASHTPPVGPSGVLTTRSDYYTIPSVDELDTMATTGSLVEVENFSVGRHGYGVIVFPGKTDVHGLNLDELVYIGHKEVAVYQNDSCKPPQGEGLNKRAIVTLENTWPLDKTKKEPITDPKRLLEMRYAEKVERSTTKIGARFKEYHPETGSWIFEVDHFSKYKLQENTSEKLYFNNDNHQ